MHEMRCQVCGAPFAVGLVGPHPEQRGDRVVVVWHCHHAQADDCRRRRRANESRLATLHSNQAA